MQLPVVQHRSGTTTHGLFSTWAPRSIEAVRVLRISLTDRCNLRCVYCMPEEGLRWLEDERLLSDDEICQVIQTAVKAHGIRRFKLTGGEPTVRRDLVGLVDRIRRIEGIVDLSMTTNGIVLERLARPLREAGLDRVTISIDSLRPKRFRRITRVGDLQRVLRGLAAAGKAGFGCVKINCVVMRGFNDDEVVDFARLTIGEAVSVRLIEYMPLGNGAGCGGQQRGDDLLVPEAQMRQTIEQALGPLVRVSPSSEPGVGPAVMYRLARGKAAGRVGFISAMSNPFCGSCNRLRLTAEGELRSCLFEGGEVDLKPIVRSRLSQAQRQEQIAEAMARCAGMKPDQHGGCSRVAMSRVGG